MQKKRAVLLPNETSPLSGSEKKRSPKVFFRKFGAVPIIKENRVPEADEKNWAKPFKKRVVSSKIGEENTEA